MAVHHDVFNEAKRLWVVHCKSGEEISELVGVGASTVYRWAATPDTDGRTWHDLREAERDARYESASPRRVAARIIEQMARLVESDDFTTKDADAVAKLQRSLDRIVDTSYQVPVMYSMLEGLVMHLKDHHGELLTPDLIAAIRSYKDLLRVRLGTA